jgi:hypothetical protein
VIVLVASTVAVTLCPAAIFLFVLGCYIDCVYISYIVVLASCLPRLLHLLYHFTYRQCVTMTIKSLLMSVLCVRSFLVFEGYVCDFVSLAYLFGQMWTSVVI